MSRSLTTQALLPILLVFGLCLPFAAPVTAQPGLDRGIVAEPADFSKSFSPNPAAPNTVTTLVFDIFNDTGEPITDIAFTDNLPAGVTVADPAFTTNSCGGTVMATAGGGTISLSGGLLGTGEGCQIQVDVTASAPGNYDNTSSNLTYDRDGNPESAPAASATLQVLANRPSFSKSFADPVVRLGETTTLTFTIDNSLNGSQAFNLSFTDMLPAGLRVASPANAATTCNGGVLTAAPGSQNISYQPAFGGDAQVAAGAVCTVTVDVTAVGVGEYVNRSEPLTSISGTFVTSGRATDDVTVVVDRLALVKEFTDDPVRPGQPVTLEFRLSNLDRTEVVTDITFTDDLDATLSGLVATGTPQSNVCGAGSQLTGTSTLTLTGGTLAPEATCTFQVTLQVPAGASPGSYDNTTSDVTGTAGGSPVAGAPATDTLEVQAEPILTKNFLTDPVGAGNSTVAEFTLTNSSTADPATDVSFTDDISAFLSGVGATLPADGFCDGTGVSFPSTSNGSNFLNFQDIDLAAGASCTFQVTFQIPAGTAAGDYVNTTSEVSANVGMDAVTGDPASDTLTVVPAVSLAKTFDPNPAGPGDTVTLEFTVTLEEDAQGPATDIAFTDDLEAFLSGISVNGVFPMNDVCGAGSQLSLSMANVLSLTGGSLAPGTSCIFSLTFDVPEDAVGGVDYTNTTSPPTATVATVATTGVAAESDLTVRSVDFSKEFIDDPSTSGEQVVLRFVLVNETTDPITGIQFSDNLSAVIGGMTAVAGDAVNPCGTGSMLGGIGSSVISLSNGSLAPSGSAGDSCQFDVTLQIPPGTAAGDYANTTSSLQFSQDGSLRVQDGASDTLVVIEPLLIEKEFTDDPVTGGDTVTLEFTLTNDDPDDGATGLSFTDDLDAALAGLTVSSIPDASPCGAGSTLVGTGTSMLTFTNGSLGPADSCTFEVILQVPANPDTSSPAINTTSDLTGTVDGAAQTAPGATDELELLVVELSKSFDGSVAAGGTVDLTFTLENTSGAESFNALAFTDDLDAVIPGLVAVDTPQNDVCGTGSQITGTSALTFSGGQLAPGASCSFTISLQAPADAMPGTYQNTTSQVFETGLPVGNSAMAPLVVEPPPTFTKAFSPDAIGAGDISTLTFTIDNTASGLAATGLDFTDNLPAGVEVAATPNESTTCAGGTLTADAGTGTISYTGGTVAAGASCTVSVDVTSTTPGSYVNTSGDLTSSSGNSGPATDTLEVEPNPGFTKMFAPNPIATGGVSTLTFTIDNTGSGTAATGLDFTDNLPAGVVVATPSNASTTCTGGTLTAPDGGGSISYTGGTVAAMSSCTVSVDVTAAMAGSFVNTSGDLTSSLGNSGPAMDTLGVNDPPAFSKVFAPDVIGNEGVSTLTFTIDNSGSTAAATGLDFTDNLPGGVVVADVPNASTTCTGGTLTAAAGTGTISYTGGSVAAGATCTVSVDVTSSMPGTYVNTSGDLTSSQGNSGSATDTLEVEPPPTFDKEFQPPVINSGGVSTLVFTIDNSASTIATTDLDFTDDLPTGVVVATPANASTTCGGGTLTADAGTGTISYTGGTVAAGATCTVSVDVTAAAPGTYDNVSGPLTSSNGSSGTASATLAVSDELVLVKSFDDPSLPGGAVELTFTLANGLSSTVTDLSFTDDLDATLSGLASISPPQTDICGPGSQISGASTVSFTGGTLGANEMCTFSITVRVPGDAPEGSFLNTTSAVTGSQGGMAVSGDPAEDTLDVVQLDFAKSFAPTAIMAGDTVLLQFVLTNPDPVRTAEDLSFTDDLNTFIPGATAVGLPQTGVCGAGSTVAGTSVITLTGGSLGPGETCAFSVQVMVPNTTPDGAFVNETSALNATVDGAPVIANAAPPATDVLAVGADILAIPTLSEWMLLLFALSLGGVAVWRMRG